MANYTYPTDTNATARNRLRALMARASAAVNHDQSLRIAIFGDSTWTSPGGYGVLPMHHFYKRMGQLFGNIAGSPLMTLASNSGTPFVRGAGQAVQSTSLATTYDCAGMYTKGVPYTGESGSYAADITFRPYSGEKAAVRHILAGNTFFPTANQRLEIYCSRRASSAESLLIEYRPTDKAFSLFESILTSQQETLAVPGLAASASTYEIIRVRTANAYNPSAGKPFPQWWIKSGVATTVGAGSVAPPLVNGVRVLNANPVGAIIDTISAGGYTSRQWFGDTNNGGGGGTHVNAAAQAVQFGHDVWIFAFGTNDFYGAITAADWRRNYYDTDGTNNHGMIGELIDECEARSLPVPLIIITIPPFRCNDGGGSYAAYKAQHALAWTEAQGLVDELQAAGYDAIARDTKSESDAMGFNATINDFYGLTDRGTYSTSSVSYSVNDFYLSPIDGNYYKCLVAHTSSGTTEPTDDGVNNVAIQHQLLHVHIDGAPTSTSNVVHWSDAGAEIMAECTSAIFREHATSNTAVLDATSLASIVAAINADATQITQQTNAATAATQATAAALDASKIPRLTDAIAAGAAVRRNKVAATSATLDETLEATP